MRSTSAPACCTSELTWHTRVAAGVSASSRSGSSASSTAIWPCCACRSNCSTEPAAVTITSQLVNRQDVAACSRPGPPAPTAPRAHLRPARPRTGAAGTRRRRLAGGGTVTLGFRCCRQRNDDRRRLPPRRRRRAPCCRSTPSSTPATATTTISLDAGPGDTDHVTKYVAYHSSEPGPRGIRRRAVDELAGRCRGTLDAAAGGRLGRARSPSSRPGSTGSGHAPTSPSRATTPHSRRSAGTCSRWPRLRPDRRARHRRQGGHGRRLRRSLLLGHRDLHGPDARVHQSRRRPRPAALPPSDAARRTPAGDEMSQRGALYPWRTINGEEASAYYPAGTAQYHIDADIAYAIDRYVTATGDTEFLRDEGAEMLVEIARLFADLGFYDERRSTAFHIHGVTGPDEYTAVVDDNVYTNVMARFTLRFAADTVTRAPVRPSRRPTARSSPRPDLDDDEVAAWIARRRRDVRAVRRRARHQPPGRRLPRPRAVGLGGHAARQVPAAAQLPPARDLPPPGAQAGRRGAGDVPAQRRVRAPTCSAATSTTTTRSRPATRRCRRACRRSWPPRSATPTWRRRYFRRVAVPRHRQHPRQHGRRRPPRQRRRGVGRASCTASAVSATRGPRPHRAAPAGRLAARCASACTGRGGDIAIAVDPDGATVTVESGEPVPILADGTVTDVAAGDSLRVDAVRTTGGTVDDG